MHHLYSAIQFIQDFAGSTSLQSEYKSLFSKLKDGYYQQEHSVKSTLPVSPAVMVSFSTSHVIKSSTIMLTFKYNLLMITSVSRRLYLHIFIHYYNTGNLSLFIVAVKM